MTNPILVHRTWRYATKKFDPTQNVPQEALETLLEATRLSASSFGLQPYHILVIADAAVREKLKPVSWNQSQITDASHILVFAHLTKFGEELVDQYLQKASTTRTIPLNELKPYGDMMKTSVVPLPPEAQSQWTARQAYLAFGNAMQAAAELKIDSCPIEGFQPEAYNEILGLNQKHLNAAIVLALGYRAKDDANQHLPKVRKTKEELFSFL